MNFEISRISGYLANKYSISIQHSAESDSEIIKMDIPQSNVRLVDGLTIKDVDQTEEVKEKSVSSLLSKKVDTPAVTQAKPIAFETLKEDTNKNTIAPIVVKESPKVDGDGFIVTGKNKEALTTSETACTGSTDPFIGIFLQKYV